MTENKLPIPLDREDLQVRELDEALARDLFPLFRADIDELVKWFGFDRDYALESDLEYLAGERGEFDLTYVPIFRGTPCGRIGLYDYDPASGALSCYYWVASPYRHKGIAKAALDAVTAALFRAGIRSILFEVDRENAPSIRLLSAYPCEVTARGGGSPMLIYTLTPSSNHDLR